MTAHVVVIGGGLAGLTAACDLADRGARVTLLEARARLGGATFSFDRDGIAADNGQHVLLRCYTDYRGLLSRLGSGDGIELQDRFTMPVLARDGTLTRLSRTGGPAPLHLAAGLARYAALSPADRLRILPAAAALRLLDPADPALDDRSFGDWLAAHGQNSATLAALWNLISVAALNCDADEASLALAVMVFRTALLDRADAADIGVPRVPLDDLHVRPAEKYLADRDAVVRTRAPVREVARDGSGFAVRLDDERLTADAVVVAAPPDAAAGLCPAEAGLRAERLRRLGSAPIVNVHVVYERPVTDLPFVATVGSPVQWIFDRTRVAGLSGGQYLTISLSAAGRWLDTPARELRETFLPELGRLLPAAAHTPHTHFFVTRERRATFRQAPGTARLRPEPSTALPGLVLAGAWTATGWPDTMEGAVRSGHTAAGLVTDQVLGGAA
ncbi:squalene-associated FAD-dependent desaturase [Prauserella shujinwangii]|uniref:Squalene-associated FAD-dependent desaturase n=1 Tax=Prauserella shujinwangii TaxID=1453103 RepID=A0A2T0LQY1_9PSEU|nr:hydroxysqualene dehydroxylase HpnE [Prauserella shujinwangii]PRX45910.1 squalene-associated FAD-dependent desaturase [Prauserella shujinwangii]